MPVGATSTPLTAATLADVVAFASTLASTFFNRGVALIGRNRAAPFLHLVPVFGSVMAIVLLGEELRAHLGEETFDGAAQHAGLTNDSAHDRVKSLPVCCAALPQKSASAPGSAGGFPSS